MVDDQGCKSRGCWPLFTTREIQFLTPLSVCRVMLATRGRVGARRLLLLTLASTTSALRLHRVPNGGASPLARREALALGLASGLAVSTQPVSADTPPTAAAPPTAARSVRESIEALRAAPPSDSGKPLPSRSLFTRRYFTRETADVEYPSWFQGSWKCTSTLEQVRPEHSPSPSRSRSPLTFHPFR